MRATTKQLIEIHVNCPSDDVAAQIADELVTTRLAACANIVGPIASTYWWDGRIERDSEALLILKTRPQLFDQVVAAVRRLHPDDVPSIIGHLVSAATPDYLEWVHDNTADDRPAPD